MNDLTWPDGFERVPAERWTREPVGTLALKYDTVEQHGWYDNLDPTVESVARHARDGAIVMDYSGGTGIFTQRLLERLGDRPVGVVIVDSSPKFLRLALDKLGDDPRVAFRLIRYLKPERRLQLVDEVVEPPMLERGFDAVVSTNAVHLYYDLRETLGSWRRALAPGGRVFVQSGNIRNSAADRSWWIIDETVEHIHRAAMKLVRDDERWGHLRPFLDDVEHLAAHDALRRKIFLPVRPLSHYRLQLEEAGFEVAAVEHRPVPAAVSEWYEFLAVYHEGVLGWVGGAQKVTGRPAPEAMVSDRLALLREAMEQVFGGADTFTACWTYLTCHPRGAAAR